MELCRSRSGKLPIFLIIGVLFVLAVGGVAFMKFKGGHKKHGKEKPVPAATTSMDMGEMVVNLADTREPHYLKTKIVLEIEGTLPAAGGGEGESSGAPPKMRDAVITALSARTFTELLTPTGKDALKESIKTAVNKTFDGGQAKVADVYFSDFAMQ